MDNPKDDVTIVFDVDDTICHTKNRNYADAQPNKKMIDKINYLHDVLFYKVVLYTSRGVVSCGGVIEDIIKSNQDILQNWLYQNNVHYDELQFGKPIGDLYVDDKCMMPEEFLNQDFKHLSGGSGYRVERLGNIVKKFCSHDKAMRVKQWYEYNESMFYPCKAPKIISSLYDGLHLEYINGRNMANGITKDELHDIVRIIFGFASRVSIAPDKSIDSFNVKKHIDVLNKNVLKENAYHQEEINACVKTCTNILEVYSERLENQASFCHGDAILSNIIKSQGDYYFIDPEMDVEASSYLLDLAKLNMSLYGYEPTFGLTNYGNDFDMEKLSELKRELMDILSFNGLYPIVMALTYMYAIRLWRYKVHSYRQYERRFTLDFIKSIEDDLKRTEMGRFF